MVHNITVLFIKIINMCSICKDKVWCICEKLLKFQDQPSQNTEPVLCECCKSVSVLGHSHDGKQSVTNRLKVVEATAKLIYELEMQRKQKMKKTKSCK